MNATGFIEILEAGLIPYINVHSRSTRFMQDNDPKHALKRVGAWLENNGINWWKTPAESPGLNLIENMWHGLVEYIRRVVKSKKKEDFISGILEFWSTVDENKCKKYIHHLRKVIPKVIEENGGPTG